MAKEPKWGHLTEIDYQTKVGTEAWFKRHSENIQKLSAFRFLHTLAPHEEVREMSEATVLEMLELIESIIQESKRKDSQ